MTEFEREVDFRLKHEMDNSALSAAANDFMMRSIAAKYSYNFFWLGRPINIRKILLQSRSLSGPLDPM